jgi:MFS transporter, DHA2 family, methylenomycin A resistance protein
LCRSQPAAILKAVSARADHARIGSLAGRRDAIALVGICLGFFVVLLDATIVNVALNAIAGSIGGSLGDQQWTLNAYTVTFAAFMLTAGGLGDRVGARACFLGGLGVFAAATALCAAAPSMSVLIAARAIQGIGAAALVPCSLSLIADRFPPGPERARALGAWGGISGIGLAAGPLLGGLLVGSVGWRAVFLVAIPFALLAVVLVAVAVTETPRRSVRPDFSGQVLAIAALGAITAALTSTSRAGWLSEGPIALGMVGVAAAISFVAIERRAQDPMLPLLVFANRRFSAATAVGGLFNFGLYGTVFCLALFTERAQGHSAIVAGLMLAPLTVVVAGAARLSGLLGARHGPRLPMLCGLGGGLIAAVLLALVDRNTPAWQLAGAGALLGLVGLAMPAMTSVALAASPPGRAGLGSAVLNTARQIGGATGVALLGSLLEPHQRPPILHVAMAIVAAAYALALILTATWIQA